MLLGYSAHGNNRGEISVSLLRVSSMYQSYVVLMSILGPSDRGCYLQITFSSI